MIGRLCTSEKTWQKLLKEIERSVKLFDNADGVVVVDDVVLCQFCRARDLVPIVFGSESS